MAHRVTGLSVLVVDDEPLARRRLVRLLDRLPWVETVVQAGNVDEACDRAADRMPDILLLDIQMPGGDGFALIERWADNLPATVFVTAFDHHALRAFEVSAVDYVTKPIEPGRFHQAMERARSTAEGRSQADRLTELNETVASLKRSLEKHVGYARPFWVKYQGGHVQIHPDRIIRVQAERDYVRLHVRDADYLYQDSLLNIGKRLDPGRFVRVHRGAIVRRDTVIRTRPGAFGALILVLEDDTEVRVGRTYGAAVRAMFSKAG